MAKLTDLLEKNRAWARQRTAEDPGFFSRLAQQQRPEYLWIGCSDSRVPANQIVDLLPGEIFVHRNIANLVQHSDLNCLAVLQFAVESLQVKHIIVCGHYGCGGVAAAINDDNDGLVDYWVWNIKLTYKKHQNWLDELPHDKLARCLCELNVIEQVMALSQTRIVQDTWLGGNPLEIHGWIYDIQDGILHDLGISCRTGADTEILYSQAIEKIQSSALPR